MSRGCDARINDQSPMTNQAPTPMTNWAIGAGFRAPAPAGKKALKKYVSTWPAAGFEFRKQIAMEGTP